MGRRRRFLGVSVAVALVSLLLTPAAVPSLRPAPPPPPPSASPALAGAVVPASGPAGSPGAPGQKVGAGGPYLPATYPVRGTILGFAHPPAVVAGANVSIVSRPCKWIASPTTCPFVVTTTSGTDGSYQLNAPNGAYIVYSNNSTSFGGAWQSIIVSNAGIWSNLTGFPWVPYGNASFVLPHWTNLSTYASNCNAEGPCGSGVYGTQVPLLSWTESGVYYVNATSRLVFYSFLNGTVRNIAPWHQLYDDVMVYEGTENTDWITSDGAYVYEFGCDVDCTTSSTGQIDFYAVNTTTGRTFSHNFTGVTFGSLATNGQTNMIGEDGNASIAIVVDSSGTVYAYNLWNRTQWQIGVVPFFEANNLYWIPNLNSFVDIEAQGSTSDRIAQFRLEGPAPGTKLVGVYSGTYGNGFLSNGVNGFYENVTSHHLAVTEGSGGGVWRTEVFDYGRDGVLTGNYLAYPETGTGAWPDDSSLPNVYASEHRPTTTSYGPWFMGFWDGLFSNGSFLFEPSNGGYVSSNVTFALPGDNLVRRQNTQNPSAVEGMFYNSSYSIMTQSISCRTNGTTCPIRGSATGSVPGTIWWTWRLGLPEFPFPASDRSAETLPPGPLSVSVSNNSSAISVRWSTPADRANPILNYTLFWGLSPGAYNHVVDLWAQNSSYTIEGIAANTPVGLLLQAWNLHWHNTGTVVLTSTAPSSGPLTVGPLIAAPARLDAGMNLTLRVTVSGGQAPLTYTYSGLPAGCSSSNRPTMTCVPSGVGTFALQVAVSDSAMHAASASAIVTVTPALVAGIRESTPATDVGNAAQFDAVVTGVGAPPYGFAWTAAGVSSTGPGISPTFVSAGRYPVVLTLTDSVGGRSASQVEFIVNPPLSVHERFAPGAMVDVGVPVTPEAVLTGGTPPIVLSFEGSVACYPAPGSANLTCVAVAPGAYLVQARATDFVGETAVSNETLVVNPDPMVTSLAASPDPVAVGAELELKLAFIGGTPPFRAEFSGLPPGCTPPGSNLTSLSCRPTTAGTYSVLATVLDGYNHSANRTVVLTVGSASAPGGSVLSLPNGMVLLLLLGGAAAAATIWRLRRRRPPAPQN